MESKWRQNVPLHGQGDSGVVLCARELVFHPLRHWVAKIWTGDRYVAAGSPALELTGVNDWVYLFDVTVEKFPYYSGYEHDH